MRKRNELNPDDSFTTIEFKKLVKSEHMRWLSQALSEQPMFKIVEFLRLILRQSNFKLDKYYRGLVGSFWCLCGAMGSTIHGLFECRNSVQES